MDLNDLLESLPSSAPGDDMCFMSVKEAKESVDGLAGIRGGGAYYRQVAAYVLDPDNDVFGTANEFFNFATSYLGKGDYHSALALCRHALGFYPYDVDLVAAAFQAATGCGRFDVCSELLDRAARIPKGRWNWRLFTFIVEYYQACLGACDPAQADELLDRALAVARDYERCLPTDERAYNKEAELLLSANRRDEAQRVLEHAIFGKVQLDDGESVSLVAAQCCITMLDDVLGDSTDYKLIAKVARRGVRNTARPQPTASIGYFVYREALALDAIVCDADDAREGFRNVERVRDALVTYRCAYSMLKDRPVYRSTIERRYSILCHKSGIGDMPLEDGRDA